MTLLALLIGGMYQLWLILISMSMLLAQSALVSQAPVFEEWALVVLPDTQRLAEQNATAFNNMMDYVYNQIETRNIKMLIHVGDVVQDGDSATHWNRAMTAMGDTLDAIPHMIGTGNWDYDNNSKGSSGSGRPLTIWNTYLPIADIENKSWFVSNYPSGSTENTAAILTINGRRILFINLEFAPRGSAITWAEGVIANTPHDRIILNSHNIVNNEIIDGDLVQKLQPDDGRDSPLDYSICDYSTSGDCLSGLELFDDFMSNYDQLILSVSGHRSGYAARVEKTVNGKTQHHHMHNWQYASADSYGASATVRFYTFNDETKTAQVTSYNPHTDTQHTDDRDQFSFTYH